MPDIMKYQQEHPSLYTVITDKSIYIGISIRDLYQRLAEHCTYKQDNGKTTFDMLAYENAKVYCIGVFKGCTIKELEQMSVKERDKFRSKMETLETLLITLAYLQLPHLELVNRKQILDTEEKVFKHLVKLPLLDVEIYFHVLDELGFTIPNKVNVDSNCFIEYDSSSKKYYVLEEYFNSFKAMADRNCLPEFKDIQLQDSYLIDYAILTSLLFPGRTVQQGVSILKKISDIRHKNNRII